MNSHVLQFSFIWQLNNFWVSIIKRNTPMVLYLALFLRSIRLLAEPFRLFSEWLHSTDRKFNLMLPPSRVEKYYGFGRKLKRKLTRMGRVDDNNAPELLAVQLEQ